MNFDPVYGRIAYEAYRNHTGGVSLISGKEIPEWDQLPEAIQKAWDAAGLAAVENYQEEHRYDHWGPDE
jgi:hypothetical protein